MLKDAWGKAFKECDIRGLHGTAIDRDFAFHLGRAIASEPEATKVVVGGDVRVSTPELLGALKTGLVASGAKVIDLGMLPTPVVYFGAREFDADVCVIVTASHNPPEYNGFKVAFRMPARPRDLERLRDRMQREDYASAPGAATNASVIDAYENALRRELRGTPERRIKAVIDCGNGAFSEFAPRFLSDWGVDVVPLFCAPDGRFPNRHPNPSIPEHLGELRKTVLARDAEIGIAFDGDGDRMVFMDERGRALTGDERVCVFVEIALRDQPPGQKIVHDIKCSRAVRDVVQRHGGLPLVERSGHAFIKRRMIEENALLGGEMSGHYFHRALHGGDDGLYSACLLLRELARRPLAAMLETIPAYCTTPDIRIPAEDRDALMNALLTAHRRAEGFSTLDGARVENKDGWALARISVTEPVMTFRFEANTPDALLHVARAFVAPIPSLAPQILEKVEAFTEIREAIPHG